ncbi:MAG: ABC-F family ATP-binding cassette domain-containing protein [Nitriliruptorales bacterium]|nr:ABC-F family ATP-binding cassette domain-containing protein [Nitriliruptorales bacterium]
MHVTSLTRVAKRYDGRTLFADVSFGLTTEDRVGVVGPNGVGKSTLLRLVAGIEPPDEGEVVHRQNTHVTYLPQAPQLPPDATTLELAMGHGDAGVRQHEAEAMLDRLELDPSAQVGTLSGGQQRRVSVAQALLPASDLLLLDEPTNHLDVDTIDWLEEELTHRNVGLLLVTHDRYFLERLTNRMLELEPRPGRPAELHWHQGSFAALLEARTQREERRAEEQRRRENLLKKEIAWLRRDPKARTSKPKFRLEQIKRLEGSVVTEDPVTLQLGTGRRRLGTHVIDVSDVSVAYEDEVVLDEVSLSIGPGDRVGVVGPNGSGKTTLLRVCTGRLEPDSGQVDVGTTVEFGVFEQNAAVPAGSASVLDSVLAVGTHIPLANGERLPAERLAERFGFDPELQRAAVANLSGGERRRLALLHTLVRAPNVLVLDEPTNDLDLDTLNVLEDHLDGFAGTIIVATHDRFFLDRVTDRLVAIRDGTLERHLDWERYRAARRREDDEDDRGATDRSGTAAANRARQRRHRELRSLEERMEKLTAQRDELHRALAKAGADHERARELDTGLRAVEDELAEVEEAWLELSTE